MKRPSSIIIVFAYCLLFFGTGCVHTWKVSAPPVRHDSITKSPLKVNLIITDELQKSFWQSSIAPLESARIPVGDELIKNCEAVVREVFSEVNVVKANASRDASADYDVIPRMALMERTQPTTIAGNQTTSILLEWRINTKEGKTVWADTLRGEAATSMGNNPRKSAEAQVKRAFAVLFTKSFLAIACSPPVAPTLQQQASGAPTGDMLAKVNPEVVVLKNELQSTDVDVVVHALKVLRKMDAPEAVPAILPLLKSTKRGVLRDSCRTLAVLGNKDVIPAIQPLTSHPDGKVRKDATDAIATLTSKP